LENEEAYKYDVQLCNYWIKVIKIDFNDELRDKGPLKVYCDINDLLNNKKPVYDKLNNDISFRDELNLHDKITYGDLNDSDMLILYIDPLQPEFKNVIHELKGKNIILRYKFK
jgi:hypothetical protein